VAFKQNGQDRVVHANREVILSAGAINSPQILMRSGVGAVDDI
jgi:choline dehydrogenase